MAPVKVMVNGIPGNMAGILAAHILKDDRFRLVARSLTGPEITSAEHVIDSVSVGLIQPNSRDQVISDIIEKEGDFISVDYTHPSAINTNVEFYCRNHLPFVMGTTGGDETVLKDLVAASSISAVIAPNMAKQIVGFQAMMEYAAKTFPGLFDGYTLHIRESHQHGKADTSGTAKAMVRYFNLLGTPFTEESIKKERNPKLQHEQWGIAAEFLGGHAWHTYTLESNDRTVRFEFSHNVNGRDIYAKGTLDAVAYLYDKIKAKARGKVYSMIDVLKRM